MRWMSTAHCTCGIGGGGGGTFAGASAPAVPTAQQVDAINTSVANVSRLMPRTFRVTRNRPLQIGGRGPVVHPLQSTTTCVVNQEQRGQESLNLRERVADSP